MATVNKLLVETPNHAVSTESGKFTDGTDRTVRITNKIDGSSGRFSLVFLGELLDNYKGNQELPVTDDRIGNTAIYFTGRGDEIAINNNSSEVTFNAPEDLDMLIEKMAEDTTIVDMDGDSVSVTVD